MKFTLVFHCVSFWWQRVTFSLSSFIWQCRDNGIYRLLPLLVSADGPPPGSSWNRSSAQSSRADYTVCQMTHTGLFIHSHNINNKIPTNPQVPLLPWATHTLCCHGSHTPSVAMGHSQPLLSCATPSVTQYSNVYFKM